MRIVLDTNVTLSALLWRGPPYHLLELVRHQERVRLFTSAVLLAELAEILIRPVPAKRLAIIGRSAQQVLTDYLETVELVTPLVTPTIIVADPDDDHVIAAAIAAEAGMIVSGDRHVLTFGTHRGIAIVRPTEALARLSG